MTAMIDLGPQFKALPSLKERFIVDFVNGIEVAGEHLRHREGRSGFWSRLYDGVTGSAWRRDQEIQRNLASGVGQSLQWLAELTDELAKSNYALSRVQDRLTALRQDVTLIADFAADTREQLERFEDAVGRRLDAMHGEIQRVDLEQRALQQLTYVMARWKGGAYARFSLLQRLFAALDELNWGSFGQYVRHHRSESHCQTLLDHLATTCISQLKREVQGLAPVVDSRLTLRDWTEVPLSSCMQSDRDALSYLGDWSSDLEPYAYAATQRLDQPAITIPRLFSVEFAAVGMINEFFQEGLSHD